MNKKLVSVFFVLVLSLIFLPHRVKAATVIDIYPEMSIPWLVS